MCNELRRQFLDLFGINRRNRESTGAAVRVPSNLSVVTGYDMTNYSVVKRFPEIAAFIFDWLRAFRSTFDRIPSEKLHWNMQLKRSVGRRRHGRCRKKSDGEIIVSIQIIMELQFLTERI